MLSEEKPIMTYTGITYITKYDYVRAFLSIDRRVYWVCKPIVVRHVITQPCFLSYEHEGVASLSVSILI